MTEIIIDQNGRRGLVTRSPYHPGGVFVRPEGSKHAEGPLTMDTFWHLQPDGSYTGRWVDSPVGGALLTAKIS